MPKQYKRRKSVMIDTSYLITLFDDSRPNHDNALAYYKYFIAESIDMYISSIVASEYQVKSDINAILGTKNFIACDFHTIDGITAGELHRKLNSEQRGAEPRNAIKDDIKLLAQCKNQKMDYIITEDESTLARYCRRLEELGELNTVVIPVNTFDPSLLRDGQTSLFDNSGIDF